MNQDRPTFPAGKASTGLDADNAIEIHDSRPVGMARDQVNLNKVRGFSINIILAIGTSPTTTTAIIMETGLPNKFLQRYLWNLRGYGLIERAHYGIHQLTDLGMQYYTILKAERKLKERRKKAERKLNVRTPVVHQLRIDPWAEEKNPSKIEQVVVEAILKNYNESSRIGSARPFLEYADLDIIRLEHGILEEEFVQGLKDLNKAGIIYLWPKASKAPNTKVGLTKEFIKWLKSQHGNEALP